jgi:hypothetical protein
MKYVFLFFILLTCQKKSLSQIKQQDVIEKAKWLVGSWKGTYNKGPFYEAWRIHNNVLVNFTIEIKNGDTSVIEQTAIRANENKIVFGKKGDWLLKRITGNEIVLENDTAKYSNRIIFLHLDNDHWFTVLENPGSTIYYDMEKIPALDAVVDRFLRKN